MPKALRAFLNTPTAATLFTILVTLVLGTIKVVLNQQLHLGSPFLLFYTAVVLSAWRGGFWQGMLSASLSGVIITAAIDLAPASSTVWGTRFTLYFLDCLIITAICTQLRHALRRADRTLEERRQLEGERRMLEDRLHHVFEANMIGLVFSRPDATITHANDYFLNLIGATRDELRAGKLNWRDFTPDDQRAISDRGLHAPFEKEYLHRDGHRVPVLVGTRQIDDQNIVAFILETSEAKRSAQALDEARLSLEERVTQRTAELTRANEELSKASEQLRESRAFLDSVVEHIPNMIFVKDAKDLRFVRFNRAGEEILGHTQAQLLGKNDYDFFSPEQADFFTAKDRDVIREGVVVDIAEEPIETPAGTRYLHTKKIPIFDKENRPMYLLGISEDITARKRAEHQRHELLQAQAAQAEAEKSAARLAFLSDASAALNQSPDLNDMLEAFARVVVRHLADACFVDLYDAKLPRLDRVAAAVRESAQRPAEMRGRLHCEAGAAGSVATVAAEARPFVHARLAVSQAALLGVAPDVAPLIFPDGDGSCMVVPLSHHGEVMGVLTLVSRHPEHYGDLDLAIALDLAKRAAFAIDNSILYGRANEASRAKSAFLANISHEIRTPLGAMLGFAELSLEEGGLSDEHTHNLNTIVRNGQQLLRIVDEVLDLSKVESDRLEIERVPFNLAKLLEDVAVLLSLKAEERGLTLTIRTLGTPPAVLNTDPLRLRQILLNMIGNALKFTEKGGVDVQVRYRSRADGMGQLEILVIDTGIGIFPGQEEKLFQPFVQADGSMTRRYGGTGLGLFLSRRFARLLGGDVVLAHSSPKKGSSFRITLEAEPGEGTLPAAPERGEAATVLPTADQLVLVVDDAKENRMLVNAYLSRMGLKVDMAHNGREGVDMARANQYAVVLMDLQMPEMDGFEALNALRSEGYLGPIIAVTAHAMKGDRERCLQVGFDDYLCKPLSKQALADCLANFLV